MKLSLVVTPLLVILLAGCRETDAPSATPVASSPATVVVSPTRTPSPRSTATATRTPVPTPAPVVNFHFDSVAADDQALIRLAIEIASRYLLETAGVQVPKVDIFASTNASRLGFAYFGFVGAGSAVGSSFAIRISNSVAEANIGALFVYTQAPLWKSSNAVQRVRVVTHEFAHVLQFELMGRELAQQFFTRRAGAPQAEGPSWLFEGTADLVSWRAMEAAALTTLEDHLQQVAGQLAGSDLHPRDMEAFIDYLGGGADSIDVSLLAAELLLRGRGEASLVRYFALLRTGAAWQTAFGESFGESPEAFYARFDEYRASGFARP